MSPRKHPRAVALGRLGGRVVSEAKRAHLARIAALGAASRWGHVAVIENERLAAALHNVQTALADLLTIAPPSLAATVREAQRMLR